MASVWYIVKQHLKTCRFKGGTSLSKVYFPSNWRLSEDLDFTLIDETDWDQIAKALSEEVPRLVVRGSDIVVALKDPPHINPTYLQSRFQYMGPIAKNTVKIEVSKERFVGEIVTREVPRVFDYPKFSLKVYTIENILAEKIRTLLERGHVKDYYDVWRLLEFEKFDARQIKKLFLEKCKAKGIEFTRVEQFFPKGLIDNLRPHMRMGLTRLSPKPLPALETILKELRARLEKLIG